MSDVNNNSVIQGKVNITSLGQDSIITTEVNEEFSLPDYVPEVRKVLCVRARVLPEGKFMSDSGSNTNLEFDGIVTYNVIYTDDEGRLCSTPLQSNYEAQSVISASPSYVMIDTYADSTVCRVLAPRKLTIKSKLKSKLIPFYENVIEENISPLSASDRIYLEKRTKNIHTLSEKAVYMQNIKMSDKFDYNGKNELTPIMCDATMTLSDCKAQNGSISARGEVKVNCLCFDGEKDIMLIKSLPLYEELDAEGAIPSDMVRCNGRCVSLSISNEQNSDTPQLFFDINCEIEGEFYRNEENTVTEDCYSTKYEMTVEQRDIDVYTVADARSYSFSVNDKFKRKDNNISEIIHVLCDAVSDKVEVKNSKCTASGRILAQVIGKSSPTDTKESEYLTELYEIPFKHEMGRSNDDMQYRLTYDVSLDNARYDGDKFAISAEVYPSYALFNKSKETILGSATIKKDKEFKRDAASVRVFFPKNGDILWEVAKKYHTTERKIMEDNSLPSDSLEGVKSIII